MQTIRSFAVPILALIALTGCGTTRRFIDQPALTIDEQQTDARQAIGQLFGSMTPPYTVQLCEADRASRECKAVQKGVTARGVGGLLLPLTLYVEGMDVKSQHQSAEGFAFDAAVHATVDRISPVCGTVGGKIVSRANNTASVELKNFYCNWVVIGNVIVNADFSIDSISLRDKVVTGFYKLTFHGTGNAAGSGYYRAVLVPKGA